MKDSGNGEWQYTAPFPSGTYAYAFLPDCDFAPNCTAADLAGVLTGVSAALSAYLFTHPDVNDFYTGLKGMPRDQQRDAVQTYFDAHPQTEADLEGIRAPAKEFRDRCDVELLS